MARQVTSCHPQVTLCCVTFRHAQSEHAMCSAHFNSHARLVWVVVVWHRVTSLGRRGMLGRRSPRRVRQVPQATQFLQWEHTSRSL
jgi:hypothetical protein